MFASWSELSWAVVVLDHGGCEVHNGHDLCSKVPRVLGKYRFAQGAVSRISAAPLSSTPQIRSLKSFCQRYEEFVSRSY